MSLLLYACSSNAGKIKEFVLAAQEVARDTLVIQPLPTLSSIQPPEETGNTYEANAALKALHYSAFTGEFVFADDSGLEVEQLGGAPGVFSARFAGEGASDAANNELLLSKLGAINAREARFVCVIALARQGKLVETFRGEVKGQILRAALGSAGFGYDPLFFYQPAQRSFAQMDAREKLAVSHRGRAARALFSCFS